MKALYIVSSPLQMLYAIEARHYFKNSEHVLCILHTEKKEDKQQINELVKLFEWEEIIDVSWPPSSGKYRKFFKQILMAAKLNIKYKHFDNIFLGDFAFLMCAYLNHDKFYLISDGNKIIWQKDLYVDEFQAFPITRFKVVNSFFKKLFFSRAKIGLEFNYFTPFYFDNVDKNKFLINRFDWLHSSLKEESCYKQKEDSVYFLGTYLSEGIWTKYTTEEYYFWCMDKIVEYYREQGKNVIYIPHRLESRDKLTDLIRRHPSIEIEFFERGVEIEFFQRKIIPVHVSSFVSTALYTLQVIYGCKCESLAFDEEQFLPKKFITHFREIFEYYENFMPVNRELLIFKR